MEKVLKTIILLLLISGVASAKSFESWLAGDESSVIAELDTPRDFINILPQIGNFAGTLGSGSQSTTTTWSVVQLTGPGRIFCNKTVDQCTPILTSATNYAGGGSGSGKVIGSGHRLTLGFNDHQDGSFGSDQRTISGTPSDCTAANIDGNGNCTTSTNTWVCPGASVQAFGFNANGTDSTDLCYVLNSIGGSDRVTGTRSGHNGIGENYGFTFGEFASTSGSPTLDVCGETSDNTISSSKTMTALTLTGTSEAIFQVFGSSEASAVSSPYSLNAYIGASTVHFSEAAAVNVSSGTAPTWTLVLPQGAASSACAFKQ